MFSRNPLLLRDGYAPAADVARTLQKSLSTVHRMVRDERCDGVKDGAALYVRLDSIIALYRAEENESMALELEKLKAAFVLESRAKLAAEAPQTKAVRTAFVKAKTPEGVRLRAPRQKAG